MSDRREDIIEGLIKSDKYFTADVFTTDFIKDVMDSYMKECCLELLEYMAKNDVKCTWYEHEVKGIQFVFEFKGECLTKEQLFENFL